MPGGARKSREKTSCGPQDGKSKSSHGSSKKPSTKNHKNKTSISTTEEAGAKWRSTSTSSHDKSITTGRQPKTEEKRGSSLDSGSPKDSLEQHASASKHSKTALKAGSAAYLDQQVKKQLQQRKKEIVDKFMALIQECLEQKLEPFEEPCDGEGCSSRSHGSSKGGQAGNPSKRQSIGQKRQRQRDGHGGNGSDNDDGSRRNMNNKRPKTVPNDDPQLKFACPYLKYDPERFKDVRTCCGPGWKNLHRLKEHLQRSHHLPEFQCQRCYQSFRTKDELSAHLRAAKACPIREPVTSPRNLGDGYNNEQRDKIGKRSRKPGHDKWVEWYCILFNVDPASTDIPSPWHGVPNSSNWRDGHTSNPKYGQYIDHLRREIVSQVRYQLELEVDRFFKGCENSIKLNFLSKLPNIATSVHRVFQTIAPPPGLDEEFGMGGGGDETFGIPPGFDPNQLFDGIEPYFENEEGLDFNILGDTAYFEDSSHTSNLSDSFRGTSASSNTSVDYPAYKGEQFAGQEALTWPQQFSQPPLDPNYLSYGGGYQ